VTFSQPYHRKTENAKNAKENKGSTMSFAISPAVAKAPLAVFAFLAFR
jgi:hypothetical protein